MKPGPAVIGIIIAGALGYVLEPSIRPALVPVKMDEAATDEEASEPTLPSVEALPEVPPGATGETAPTPNLPDWVSDLSPDQLPEKVMLKQRVVLPVSGSEEPMVLPSGVSVTPVRVEKGYLVISPFGGPLEGEIPIVSTDLLELLGDKPPTGATDPDVATNASEAPAIEPPPDPAETPIPTPEETIPEDPEPSGPAMLTAEEIVSAMQESVRAGSIKEFTFEQVLGWKAAEDRESGGETYQSGLASYKAETIFGVKEIQAQALIKDGKVVKWIWPKSGMEIN